MRLYSGTTKQFSQDIYLNQIAGKLQAAFLDYYQFNPSPAEVTSWQNSLRSISLVLNGAGLDDHGLILEYQLPQSSLRIDCIICGKNGKRKDNAVIIELKQWQKCEESAGVNEVLTFVGGRQRDILHPSVQVSRYKMYLEDTNEVFHEDDNPIALNACSYLHNYHYNQSDVIFAGKFTEILQGYPLFTADDVEKLGDYLTERMEYGKGIDVLKRIENSKYRPSKKLMDHVADVINNKPEYILLDEQLVIYDKVFECARRGFHDKQKTVIIAKGGPGTGKSVIAINLMANLLAEGYSTHYATGSKAFTETLRDKIGSRGTPLLRYFNSYSTAAPNEIDVLICDEAHRIRETSNSRFTPKSKFSGLPQIEELLRVSKCSVFFIDDNQIVRPGEIGSVDYIKTFAAKNKSKLFEYELEAQFRCAGSDGFINWIDNTLGIRTTANKHWDTRDNFDFRIFDSPIALDSAITEKAASGNTARLAAGFCWKWSAPDSNGNLIDDVVIKEYNYSRPWNAKPDSGRLAAGIPKAALWASDPNGINQIGCIYTAQGFEFDYVGVIFGKDLVYDLDAHQWKGQPDNCADNTVTRAKDNFTDYIKNTYRVLLSRGLKGCYVYFMDKDTERFFKSQIEYH